jgi:hypothetical protein
MIWEYCYPFLGGRSLHKTSRNAHHTISSLIGEALWVGNGCIQPKEGYLVFLKDERDLSLLAILVGSCGFSIQS